MNFPSNYPIAPPKVTFLTRIYHPSIRDNGEICLEILKEKWTLSMTVHDSSALVYILLVVLMAIVSLLADPSHESPLVPEIGQQLKTNKAQFIDTARQWTKKFAS